MRRAAKRPHRLGKLVDDYINVTLDVSWYPICLGRNDIEQRIYGTPKKAGT